MILVIKFVSYCKTDRIPLVDLLGTSRSNTDFNTGITIFSEFTSEELVEFSIKDTVSDLMDVMLVDAYFSIRK